MSNSPDSGLMPSTVNSSASRLIPRRTVNRWLGALLAAPLLPNRLWLPRIETPRPLELAEVANAGNYEVGMTVGAGEYSKPDEENYFGAVRRNATVVVPISEFGQQTVDQWGTELAVPFIQRAASERKRFRIRRLFENGDYGQELQNIMNSYSGANLSNEVSGFMQRRTHGVLQTVKDALAEIHMKPSDLDLEIVFADSALWYFEGNGGWVDSPYDHASTGSWVADAWIFTQSAIKDLGFRKGTKLIYGDYGIEVPGGKGYFVRDTLKAVKEEIAERLSIEIDEVNFDVGLKGRFRDSSTPDELSVNIAEVNDSELNEYLSSMAEEVGPTHYDEFQYKGSALSMQETVLRLAGTQLDLGTDVSRGITFVNALRPTDSNHINTLIDPTTYEPLPLRQDLIQLLKSKS